MASISSTTQIGFGGSVALTVTLGFGFASPSMGSIAVDVVSCVESVVSGGYRVPSISIDDYSLSTDDIAVSLVEVL